MGAKYMARDPHLLTKLSTWEKYTKSQTKLLVGSTGTNMAKNRLFALEQSINWDLLAS